MNPKKPRTNCLQCGIENRRPFDTYCSISCHQKYLHNQWIIKWLSGEIEGGDKYGEVSEHVRRYFKDTYGEQCQRCGWNERHSVTGKVPLTFDHVDGDCRNHRFENLMMLCYNCHALTSTFGALNKKSSRVYPNRGKNKAP